MLSPQALAAQLKNGAKSSPQAWLNNLANYVKANAEFNVLWIAFDTEGKPDPVKQTTAKFISLQLTWRPYKTLQEFGVLLQQGFAAGMVNTISFQTTPVPFAISTPLVLTPGYKEFEQEHLHKATEIIKWIKSWVIPSPFVGRHSAFIGSGTHLTTR